MKFVGRQREFQMLNRFYKTSQAGLMILYGRRRVGKTALLSTWLERQKIGRAIFWTAPGQNAARQLRDFTHTLLRADPRYGQPPSEEYSFPSWDAALEQVADLALQASNPLVLIIDEFTNLVEADPVVVSLVQRAWDHRLSQVGNLRIVVTGSLIGLMEHQVLGAQAPLYGRATMLHRLQPLPFGHLRDLFPHWTPAERVAVYAAAGGIPAYLDIFARAERFDDGLQSYLEPGSIAVTDPALLINERLRAPLMYESILATLADGYHAWSDISKMSGIDETSLSSYVQQLVALELIERRDPVLSPGSSRRGRYYIADAFLRFYYRFVVPNVTLIQRGEMEHVTEKVNSELRAFIGSYTFEDLAREWVWAAAMSGELGFVPDRVGSHWIVARKAPHESVQLDVVAVNDQQHRLFIGEAKWGTGQIARSILTNLVEHSQRVPAVRKLGEQVQYGLFSREGFTPATIEAAKEQGARLVSLPQMESTLVQAAARSERRPSRKIDF